MIILHLRCCWICFGHTWKKTPQEASGFLICYMLPPSGQLIRVMVIHTITCFSKCGRFFITSKCLLSLHDYLDIKRRNHTLQKRIYWGDKGWHLQGKYGRKSKGRKRFLNSAPHQSGSRQKSQGGAECQRRTGRTNQTSDWEDTLGGVRLMAEVIHQSQGRNRTTKLA